MKRRLGRRLLLSTDESSGPLAGVRALAAAGYETWLAVSEPGTYAGRSRAAAGTVRVTAADRDAEAHAHEVAAAAVRLGAAAVLPGTEASLRSLAGKGVLLEPTIRLGAPGEEAVDRATDKRRLGEFARRAGLAVPPTVEVAGAGNASLSEIELPAVVKPTRTVGAAPGGRLRHENAELVRTPQELRRAVAASPRVPRLVQPYLGGTLAAICGVAWDGDVVCAVHQRSPRIWPADRGISSYAESVVPDPEREAGVAKLIRQIDWSGVFGVQFLLAEDQAYVIDFNPRLYGSLALAVAAGFNLPAIWADLLLGSRPPVLPPYRVGVRYRAEEDDPRALLAAFRRGDRRAALRGFIPRPRTVHSVFSLRDPIPSLTSLAKLAPWKRSGLRGGES